VLEGVFATGALMGAAIGGGGLTGLALAAAGAATLLSIGAGLAVGFGIIALGLKMINQKC
jgi:hypothetical protein